MNINDFNIDKYADNNMSGNSAVENNNTQINPAVDNYTTGNPDDTRTAALQLIDRIVETHTDITDTYQNWLHTGFALANQFGEEGRAYFHRLSQQNPTYNPDEADKKYTSCMKSRGDGITIKTLFHLAKEKGVEMPKFANFATLPLCQNNKNIEKSPYLRDKNKNGIVAKLAKLANFDPTSNPIPTAYTFSDKLKMEDLPTFLHPIFEQHTSTTDRDKMLLGTLNIISGLMGGASSTADTRTGIYGLYDGRRVYAPLYNIIYGAAGSSKGEIAFAKRIATPIRGEMRRQYEEQKKEYERLMAEYQQQEKGKKKAQHGDAPKEPPYRDPFVPGNSTSSAVYRQMEANGGWGMMFETEADTVSAMIASDYGNYSDLMRKAHHHEPISMNRVTDRIHIDIDEPRLSVFLTCTPGQLTSLFTQSSFENGLGSRILFYEMPEERAEFHNVFARQSQPLEETYRQMGDQFLPLYHELQERTGQPLQFVMSSQQQKQFLATFAHMLEEQYALLGSGISAFIYRLALETFRYAMVLTTLRRLSEWAAIPAEQHTEGIFRPDERALPCDDRDFQSALTIVSCLLNHTTRVYAVLAKDDDNPFSRIGIEIKPDELKVYNMLPNEEFKASEFLAIAKEAGTSPRTANRLLSRFANVYRILEPVRYGVYRKVYPHTPQSTTLEEPKTTL